MSTQATQKVRVAVVGATGVAGQEFLSALAGHPFFEVRRLAASSRSANKSYRDAIASESGQLGWFGEGELPESFAKLMVEDASTLALDDIDLVFSAMDAGPAKELEGRYAETTPVLSTTSAYRYEEDVPLLLPGVNEDHMALLAKQRQNRGWKGFVAPNPNCTTVGLAIALAPLHQAFGLQSVHMVSMQAVSGAGRSPGVVALDVVDNIIPFIPNEEEKVARETGKILGSLDGERIEPAPFGVSATCTRVGVLQGHTEAVHIRLEKPASEQELIEAWQTFGASFVARGYPSAPLALIEVSSDPYRPQVRLDRNAGDGMTTVVGRLRPDPTVENGWKFLLVSHNTKMGAGRGCVLLAEHLHAEGLLR